jgi:hypothetical protein
MLDLVERSGVSDERGVTGGVLAGEIDLTNNGDSGGIGGLGREKVWWFRESERGGTEEGGGNVNTSIHYNY